MDQIFLQGKNIVMYRHALGGMGWTGTRVGNPHRESRGTELKSHWSNSLSCTREGFHQFFNQARNSTFHIVQLWFSFPGMGLTIAFFHKVLNSRNSPGFITGVSAQREIYGTIKDKSLVP